MSEDIFVIFGAAVRADGTPSGALWRRTMGAADEARTVPNPLFIPSGAAGKTGYVESSVMRQLLLNAGFSASQVHEDNQSYDTLQSVINCSRMIRDYGDRRAVIVCSDIYHIPRCRMLFRMMGIQTRAGKIPSGRKTIGNAKWMFWSLREVPAIVYDAVQLLFRM